MAEKLEETRRRKFFKKPAVKRYITGQRKASEEDKMVVFKSATRAILQTTRHGLEVYLVVDLDKTTEVLSTHLSKAAAITSIYL